MLVLSLCKQVKLSMMVSVASLFSAVIWNVCLFVFKVENCLH